MQVTHSRAKTSPAAQRMMHGSLHVVGVQAHIERAMTYVFSALGNRTEQQSMQETFAPHPESGGGPASVPESVPADPLRPPDPADPSRGGWPPAPPPVLSLRASNVVAPAAPPSASVTEA